MAITKNDIIRASINILNRDGVSGLSMRTIAKELKIKAASLYNHISGKTELYNEIAEYMCVQCVKPDESLEAKEYVIAVAKSYRAMLLSVRDSVTIFEDSIPNTPFRVGIIKAWVERLKTLGVSEKNLMTVSNLFNNYILSFTEDEVRIKSRTPEEIQTFKNMLNPSDEQIFISERDFDEQFLFGLQLLFIGVESIGSQ